ncbi:hypothetical protein SAV14893_072070 [Streptomyces avermitilis]|uniref:Uncharacterized protein n=1 Tax=Streptomyces avermitilis TaxID=33903 RepID=A0A4D4MKU3_STRAX|nr:hypothetical protein SAVMC3_84900 [Streptomyces avermitilis]GDY67814.1 hypothetical protein SAV14893_072070 [Streptomyces avermitilis]GDY71867.1 hypothetical protein SAV31267_013520 [Streptomyces avermitilis]GDY81039.1 hypothetical protein SAVCW2_02380 [Streptomyces avermitilis]
MELPFVWVFVRGRAAPLWGQTVGRDRGRRAPVAGNPGAAPAVQWIKARWRGAHPINRASHLRTCTPGAVIRAGVRTSRRRLLHMLRDIGSCLPLPPRPRMGHSGRNRLDVVRRAVQMRRLP